jgi:hypothetical protein
MLAKRHFEELGGIARGNIPKTVIGSWMARIDTELEAIDSFASEQIAHLSEKPKSENLSRDAVKHALITMFEATQFAIRALDASDITAPTPMLSPGWDKPLRFAWLQGDEQLPRHVQLFDAFGKKIWKS